MKKPAKVKVIDKETGTVVFYGHSSQVKFTKDYIELFPGYVISDRDILLSTAVFGVAGVKVQNG
jgi:hypothetical protein